MGLVRDVIESVWEGIKEEDISEILRLMVVSVWGNEGFKVADNEGKILKLTNWRTGERQKDICMLVEERNYTYA